MSRRWRGALIGCGFFAANQMHAWRELPGVSIVALCDLDRAKAQAMADAFGVDRVYTDARTMFEQVPLDFVDIVTTVGSHRQLVELGARHCAVVVCQKPFAETLHDADAMIAACEAGGVNLLVHENFRWQRPFLEIERRLASGAIGDVHRLRLTFRHAYDIYRDQPYLKGVERLALMDVGLHLFDVARVLAGQVDSIDCRTERCNPEVRGEDAFHATLTHGNSATSIVDCSFFAHDQADLFPQTLADLEGTRGRLQLLPGYRLRHQDAGSSVEYDVEPIVPAWGVKPWHAVQDSVLSFQRHVLDVLERRVEPRPSGAHNRETLALVLAAYESAATGRPITMTMTRTRR